MWAKDKRCAVDATLHCIGKIAQLLNVCEKNCKQRMTCAALYGTETAYIKTCQLYPRELTYHIKVDWYSRS